MIWSSFAFLTLLTAVYLVFVLYSGPKYMKKREPYRIKQWIRIYNCYQIAICTYFVVMGLSLGFYPKFLFRCETFDFMNEDTKLKVLIGTWMFLGLRELEYLETVFFILRKKHNQASFLHIFHHIGSSFTTWTFIAMHAGK